MKKTPWTEEQDDLLRAHYPELGLTRMAEMLGRTKYVVLQRTKKLGIHIRIRNDSQIKPDMKDQMIEERDIIVGEIRFLARSICANDPKRLRQTLIMLDMMIEIKSLEWWYELRNKKLGHWCELFISRYEFKPIPLVREHFFNSEGTFGTQILDDFPIHRGR